jgi:hypothetical protein
MKKKKNHITLISGRTKKSVGNTARRYGRIPTKITYIKKLGNGMNMYRVHHHLK